MRFPFDNRYVRLPEHFFARVRPTPVRSPSLVCLNRTLAAELDLEGAVCESDDAVSILAGNRVPEGAAPLAQAYAGHQFGRFVPQLGDGRAILLGEVVDCNGHRRDVQLKGSGPTPFSRSGDGRAALGPVLREYLVSEAMHALGIPTTRALAAVTTGEPVLREGRLQGAILTRVAASHVRVGTFEYFAARRDESALHTLVDYVIGRHDPELATARRPALALLRRVMKLQAGLVARWLGVGFIHGVMNTDNTSISGETIDYGPCAFMDVYDPETVFSSIDRHGRYAYGAQPKIIEWNMARLAEALLPAIDSDPKVAVAAAQEAVDEFPGVMEEAWLDVMRAKLGLATAKSGDRDLVMSLLDAMHAGKADFTNTFRALCDALGDPGAAAIRSQFSESSGYDAWETLWRARIGDESATTEVRSVAMRQVNPAFIPRNYRVEEALTAAVAGDYAPFEKLLAVLARPYDEQSDSEQYRQPPPPSNEVYRTFCGT